MKQPHGRLVIVVVGLLSAAAGPAAAQDQPSSDGAASGPAGSADATGATAASATATSATAASATAASATATSATAASATDALPPPPKPFHRWASDHAWASAGLDQPVVDLEAGADGTVYALDPQGAVWRSQDGRRWRLSLEAPRVEAGPDDEDLLLEVESTYEDLVDLDHDVDLDEGQDPLDLPQDSDDVQDQDELVSGTDIALVNAETGNGLADGLAGGLWSDPRAPRTVMVGRSDGMWVSRDAGGRWTRVSELPKARAWLPLGDSLLVGAADGLYRSDDGGRRWDRVFPGLGSKRVHALANTGEVLLAATDLGLYLSVDGGRWRLAEGAAGIAVTDVLVDPNWDGGLWLATSKGLLRSDDLAQSTRLSSRNPLRGVRQLLHLDRPGHLLAAGSDGTWESVDGGTTWAPLNLGVGEPDQRALTVRDGTVLLAAANGVWRLERAPETPTEAEDQAAAFVLPELDMVVDHAIQRPGLRTEDMAVGKRVILSRFTPNLKAMVRYEPDFNRDTDYLSASTGETTGDAWLFETSLCWGLCGSSLDVYVDYDDYTIDYGADFLADRELAVVSGEVYDFTNDTAIPVAAANVASKAVQYRTAVADIVAKAWFRRRTLALQSERVAQLPLADQLAHHLDVLEQDARLDLYTDGWYSRAAAALAQP